MATPVNVSWVVTETGGRVFHASLDVSGPDPAADVTLVMGRLPLCSRAYPGANSNTSMGIESGGGCIPLIKEECPVNFGTRLALFLSIYYLRGPP